MKGSGGIRYTTLARLPSRNVGRPHSKAEGSNEKRERKLEEVYSSGSFRIEQCFHFLVCARD